MSQPPQPPPPPSSQPQPQTQPEALPSQVFTSPPPAGRKSTAAKAEYYKTIIVCCDGTGRAASHGRHVIPTNVSRFAQALEVSPEWVHPKDGKKMETQQVVLYQTGVGTDAGMSPASTFFGSKFE
jgi:uncharacterized protein (DUF2235 family)